MVEKGKAEKKIVGNHQRQAQEITPRIYMSVGLAVG